MKIVGQIFERVIPSFRSESTRESVQELSLKRKEGKVMQRNGFNSELILITRTIYSEISVFVIKHMCVL